MKRLSMALLLLLVFSMNVLALDVPVLKGRVNDYANLLKAQEVTTLETRLKQYEQETSNQVVILTVQSLQGDSLESFSIRVADSWKIGQKGKDNGVIILLAKQEKAIRIEVGKGLEGVLTDAQSSRIIREIKPHFSRGNFYDGINVAVDDVSKAVRGEFKGDGKAVDDKKKANIFYVAFGILVVVSGIFGFIHVLLGGVAGAITAPFLATGMLHMGPSMVIPAIIVGFIIGLLARFILEYGVPAVLEGGFGGGGGGFGGGGASGSWD